MNTEEHLRLGVIVGSTREGRIGRAVSDWFAAEAASRGDLDVDLIDLLDADLPAAFPAGDDERVDAYTARLDRADAFVVVTPEYNHGYPASLKQAIDLAKPEWYAKPVGFVAYGGMAGGMRSVEQLRQVFPEVHAMTIRDVVGFHNVFDKFDAAGRFVPPEGASVAAKVMLDQLSWWAHALRDARTAHPYAQR